MWWIMLGPAAAGGPCDDVAGVAQASATLRELHEADGTSAGRDARLAQVRELDVAGLICTSEQQYLAARILRRGTSEDATRALQLAEAAAAVRYPKADWLVATTSDRVATDRGELQPYGTLTADQDGRACIYEIDPTVTDAQRRAHQARPLADSYARVLLAAGITDAAPTVESLREQGLLCPSRVPTPQAAVPLRGGRKVGRERAPGSH